MMRWILFGFGFNDEMKFGQLQEAKGFFSQALAVSQRAVSEDFPPEDNYVHVLKRFVQHCKYRMQGVGQV